MKKGFIIGMCVIVVLFVLAICGDVWLDMWDIFAEPHSTLNP